jgi:hypothetical protein
MRSWLSILITLSYRPYSGSFHFVFARGFLQFFRNAAIARVFGDSLEPASGPSGGHLGAGPAGLGGLRCGRIQNVLPGSRGQPDGGCGGGGFPPQRGRLQLDSHHPASSGLVAELEG